MSIRDTLRRLVRRVTLGAAASPEPSVQEDDGGDDAEQPSGESLGYDPDELQRRVDTLTELGLGPREFVTRLLEERDGRLRQQAFTDYTDWSEPTVSRLLDDMEADGEIERVEIGREKVVCLPGTAPTADPSATDGDGDSARSA